MCVCNVNVGFWRQKQGYWIIPNGSSKTHVSWKRQGQSEDCSMCKKIKYVVFFVLFFNHHWAISLLHHILISTIEDLFGTVGNSVNRKMPPRWGFSLVDAIMCINLIRSTSHWESHVQLVCYHDFFRLRRLTGRFARFPVISTRLVITVSLEDPLVRDLEFPNWASEEFLS